MSIRTFKATTESQVAGLWTLTFDSAPSEGVLISFQAKFNFFQNSDTADYADYYLTDLGNAKLKVFAAMGDLSVGVSELVVLNPIAISSTAEEISSVYSSARFDVPIKLGTRPLKIFFYTQELYVNNSAQVVIDGDSR